ncbi:MAG TPA: methyltransferase [Streptosporangiaceae bacterium]|nr:methyltransferase [Streptosporangiaceae bacterium]
MLPLPAKAPLPSVTSLGIGNGDAEPLSTYWRFYWAVAAAQLSRWLPRRPARVLDLSGPRARCAGQAAAAGHTVIELRSRGDAPAGGATPRVRRGAARVHPIFAEAGRLGFLPAGCMDAVIAEDRVLSRQLVTEETVAEIARVLRPGGRTLLCVDSLVLGMAILAEQKFWAHLSDVPRAEVVLIPWPNGIITRCFWVDELRQLLIEADLEVEWIRPRTVLSPSTVEHVLSAAPTELPRLVRTELATPIGAESVGIHLVASAIKRGY